MAETLEISTFLFMRLFGVFLAFFSILGVLICKILNTYVIVKSGWGQFYLEEMQNLGVCACVCAWSVCFLFNILLPGNVGFVCVCFLFNIFFTFHHLVFTEMPLGDLHA